MRMPRPGSTYISVIVIFVMLVLSACNLSISGDVTPPPDSESLIESVGTPILESDADTEVQTETPFISKNQPAEDVVFYGKVTNPSGGEVPAGLQVILQNYVGMEEDIIQTTLLDENGTFEFSPVDAEEGQMFIITVEYKGIIFSSDIIEGSALISSQNLPVDIDIYENTTALAGVFIDRAHIFISSISSGQIRVIVYLLISNPTQYVITGSNGEPVLTFSLPKKAVNLQWDDSGLDSRFVTVKNGFGDRLSIFPGLQNQEILYSFDLPYDGNTDLSFVFPLSEEHGTLIVPEGFHVQGGGLTDDGQRDMDGSVVQLYNIDSLDANQALEFLLSGKGEIGARNLSWLIILLSSSVFVLVMIVSFKLLKRRKENRRSVQTSAGEISPSETQDTILDAIIKLDEEFENGLISEQEHITKKEQLKSKLKDVRNH